MRSDSVSKENLLSTEKPSKAIISLAVPATLALLAKAVYNIVDTAYIGMLGSDNALAAVGVTLPLLLIMVSIENIFAAGAAVIAGRQLGASDKDGANRTVTTILVYRGVVQSSRAKHELRGKGRIIGENLINCRHHRRRAQRTA